jgi:hypothetical protein
MTCAGQTQAGSGDPQADRSLKFVPPVFGTDMGGQAGLKTRSLDQGVAAEDDNCSLVISGPSRQRLAYKIQCRTGSLIGH